MFYEKRGAGEMTHHLKILPEYFQGVINGKKPFEIRYNDRDFKKGDRVILEEYEGRQSFNTCPDIYICKELEGFKEVKCPIGRKMCCEYDDDIYTGQRCLIRIEDIWWLDNIGEDLRGYVAFTFKILAINGKKVNAVDDKLEKFAKRIKEETGDGMFGLENSTVDKILKEIKG